MKVPHSRWRVFGMQRLGAGRPVGQLAAAIRATIVEIFSAFRAKRAFERADERAGVFSRDIHAAFFAIGPHFEHGLVPL